MKNIFISFIVLFGFIFNGYSLEKSNRELKGDKHYFVYAFDKAIDMYRRTKDLTVEGQRRLAISYRNMGNNPKSEEVYAKLLAAPSGVIAEDHYNYAMVLKNSGKYDESHKWMEVFAKESPNDLRAISYLGYKNQFADYLKADPDYKVIEQSVNTDAQDFGTSYYKDKVVYASSNARPKMIKRKYNWNGQPYLNLYIAEVKDGQLKNPKFFNKDLNGKMHDGPATFSNNGTVMAMTMNNSKDKTEDKIVELQIYLATFKDDKWSDLVPFIYNNTAYSVGHPYLLEDGNTMYFVSDMPGGFGGTDIYKTTKSANNEWTKPVNLGDRINTEGDEMFPFFDEKQQMLSFSSDGHFGLGGLDIFNCLAYGTDWGFVEKPGAPISTQYDDYAMISNGDATKGYFSSNRTEGSGRDDIYAFESTKAPAIEKMISGIAKDSQGKPIPGTFITLLGEDDEIISTMTADDKGAYSFPVETDHNYEIIGNKDMYLEGNTVTNSFGTETNIIADVTLLQDKVVEDDEINEEEIVVNNDLANVVKLNPIYFDYDKSNIRPDAAKELDKIVKVMNKYPNMEVELTSHTDCRGTYAYNDNLSHRRATSSIEYIKSKITNPDRISGKGLGETKLINGCACEDKVVSNCSPQEHQKNRRTEFIIKK